MDRMDVMDGIMDIMDIVDREDRNGWNSICPRSYPRGRKLKIEKVTVAKLTAATGRDRSIDCTLQIDLYGRKRLASVSIYLWI